MRAALVAKESRAYITSVMEETGQTHFGYDTVTETEKTARVKAVFDSVAKRYDIMNDVMSGGLHRLWKDTFVAWARPRPGQCVLDLAGGTGDIAFRLRKAGADGVIVSDINADMLGVGRQRSERREISGLNWLCADAESLPFPDRMADLVTCAFGVRNMTHPERALADIHRVLRPGGRFVCLEFSRLAIPALDGLYDAYSMGIVPRLGQWIAGDADSYRYLVESIRRFPDQDRFAAMFETAGFARVSYRNLSGGIATMHSGWKI